MAEFNSKYDVGDTIIYISGRKLNNSVYKIEKGIIKSINFGGRGCERYSVGPYTMGESEVWSVAEYDLAKKECIKMQKANHKKRLDIVESYSKPLNR